MGPDRITKALLGVIAAGIWALVLLQVSARGTLLELNAEVKAIGIDTERIHEDLDAGEIDEEEPGRTTYRAPTHAGGKARLTGASTGRLRSR